MSVLSDIKNLAIKNPNDYDFAIAVRKYLNGMITCCDLEENRVEKDDFHPHSGREVKIISCKACGKLIGVKYEDQMD